MNILFVTVGTSAISNRDIGKAPGKPHETRLRDNTALRSEANRYLDSVPQRQKPRDWIALRNDLVRAHRDHWAMSLNYLIDKNNFFQTSAELTSTQFLLQSKNFDRIYLLASDTEAGALAADINCEVMKVYWELPDVVVKRVPKLDREFADTVSSIKQTLRECGITSQDAVSFNITGGFKGTVPAITLIANEYGSDIYYQHEEINQAVRIPLSEGRIEVTPWQLILKCPPMKI